MDRLIPLIAVLTSLAIAPGPFFYFDVTPKVALVCLGAGVALFAARDAVLWRSRRAASFVGLALVQVLSLCLSTALSSNVLLSIGGSNWRRFGLATQCAVVLFSVLAMAVLAREPKQAGTWLRIFCWGGLAAALYGCAQYFGFDPILPASGYHIGEGEWSIVRPPGTLGHAGYAATFYLHIVFAGVALLFLEEGRGARVLAIATALAGSGAIVLSGTRGAMAGLVVGVLLLAYWTRPRIRRAHLAAALVLIAACTVFYLSPGGEKLRSRVRWSTEDARGGARLMLWRDAARMGLARWAAGWGPEIFSREFPRYESAELARAYPDFYHESPHNMFLDAWTAQGIAGFAVLVALCVIVVPAARHSRIQAALCAGVAAAVVAQQFLSFTGATALWFYFSIAIILALERPEREGKRIPPWALAPACLLLAVYAMQVTTADHLLASAKKQLDAGRPAEAATAYARAREWQWTGASSDLWFSRAMLNASRGTRMPATIAGALLQASAAAARAPQRADDLPNAYYNVSSFCALRDDFPCTEASLRAAIHAAPNWFKPHWTLARALTLAGRTNEAQAEAEVAVDLDGSKHAEVFNTLKQLRDPRVNSSRELLPGGEGHPKIEE